MGVTVAIPAHNAKRFLEALLPQVRAQGFGDVVVLDDGSTDGTPGWVRRQPGVTVVAGRGRVGPGRNRNRILRRRTSDIILFLDADMELAGQGMAAKVAAAFRRYPRAAVIGGLIRSRGGEPMWHNWGYEFNPRTDGLNEALAGMVAAHGHDPAVMATVRKLARGRVGHFEPVAGRSVDWVAEGLLAVRARVFCRLGGFDPQYARFHEGPDFCLRARRAGYQVRFTTAFGARHLDQRSGSVEQRKADLRESTKYYYKKNFGVSDEALERLDWWKE